MEKYIYLAEKTWKTQRIFVSYSVATLILQQKPGLDHKLVVWPDCINRSRELLLEQLR